jgi:hypothetical protein
MTLVRIVALTISDKVVRWASPGCKEWAEGLEREARVIENDWAALRWAIGSTRVLLNRRPVPLTSLDEVPAATQKFVEMMRGGMGMWLPILYGPQYGWMFFYARSWPERVGCALVLLGSIAAGSLLVIERRRLNVPWYDSIYDDPVACARFYKSELGHRSSTIWIPTFAVLCFFVGLSLGQRGGLQEHPGLGAVCMVGLAVVPWAMLQARRNAMRRIEEIDALLAEREHLAEL